MTTESYILAAALAAIVFYAATRLRRELQMLQQNSYRPERYLRWLRGEWGDTERVTDLLTAGLLVGGYFTRWGLYTAGAVGLLALYKGVRGLRVRYKKPLVFTPRARRLFVVGLLLAAGIVAAAWWLAGLPWALAGALAAAIAAPAIIILAVWVLWPVEAAINRWYVADARRILRSMPRLTVIGITGSYGKTSTKHFLHRILSERFSVVMTPGSFNTTLGVVRTIREQLKPYTEVFIVEMGAKQPGDIAEICELVRPTVGIVTAVGEQHLESFRTVENVQRTKFELIDSLPADGVACMVESTPIMPKWCSQNSLMRYCIGRNICITNCVLHSYCKFLILPRYNRSCLGSSFNWYSTASGQAVSTALRNRDRESPTFSWLYTMDAKFIFNSCGRLL